MWSDVIPQDVQALGAELAKRAACEREAGRTIYPPQEQIFRALELTTPEKVKVCLVGQDPYHEAGQANGLCFSVNRGVLFPPSLKNVFKELVSDIGCPYPKSGEPDSLGGTRRAHAQYRTYSTGWDRKQP